MKVVANAFSISAAVTGSGSHDSMASRTSAVRRAATSSSGARSLAFSSWYAGILSSRQ